MNAPTNIQMINGPDGKPAFVVLPYEEFIRNYGHERDLIPHDVVSRTVDGATPVRAWREYLGLTQMEVASRLDIAQPTYAKQEASNTLRKSSREKIAIALGITAAQLDF
ncbi:XRE family transcriptional regulator [Oxalobacteraceae bacterium CAVE-383]|nr:XRE family transcriptional regulator [Oxalobacteraceae bacterium CAVE-383]